MFDPFFCLCRVSFFFYIFNQPNGPVLLQPTVSGCLAMSTTTSSSSTTSCSIVTSTTTSTAPPAAPTANHQDGAVSIATRRLFDANNVIKITIGGERQKELPPPPKPPLTPDWEKRLSAGRKAIEEQARLMQQTTTVVPVVPEISLYDRAPTPRKTNIQRSKIVQTISIPTGGGESLAVGDGHPKRITAFKALHRLKSTLSTPIVPSAAIESPDLPAVNGNQQQQQQQPNGNKMKNARRQLSGGANETDGSVLSSYQPLEVDLDDDAIMV